MNAMQCKRKAIVIFRAATVAFFTELCNPVIFADGTNPTVIG